MFLIRTALWLTVAVMLLPSDPGDQARLYQTASQALNRAATFCDRNEALCIQAQGHLAVFKEKLAVGARMAGDLIQERMAGGPAGAQPEQAIRKTSAAPLLEPRPASVRDTLLPADRQPPWRVREAARL